MDQSAPSPFLRHEKSLPVIDRQALALKKPAPYSFFTSTAAKNPSVSSRLGSITKSSPAGAF